jgi:hypothetical protein
MNYQKIYNSLIQNRINNEPEGYTEKHHIVPRCLGGSDDDDNLVRLSYREHFVAHKLLCRINPKNYKLKYALACMSWVGTDTKRLPTSRMLEECRVAKTQADKVRPVSKETRAKQSKARLGQQTGLSNPFSKVASIFNYKTNELIASGVCISEWCEGTEYSFRGLMRTCYADLSIKSTTDNRHQYKGIYARYKETQ